MLRAAGVRQIGAAVEMLELPAPRALRPDEVLIEVQACGVGNWEVGDRPAARLTWPPDLARPA
jgi:NADPH:quinone reductase-like Zn-dependent oxidoreductase